MTTTTFTVTGMSCQHCVDAVTAEVGRIVGVEQVTVNLASGTVSVTADEAPDTELVRAAVDEAGYDLVDAEG